jgi:hypothetical protein
MIAPLLDALAGPRPYSIAHVSAATHFRIDLVVAQLLTEWAPFAAFTPKFLSSENPSPVTPKMGFLRLGIAKRSPRRETALRHIW